MSDGPYRTSYPARMASEDEPKSPLRWIMARHTLTVWKVEIESEKGTQWIVVRLTTPAVHSPYMSLRLPYSVEALVDLSKLVGGGLVDVTISEGTKT